MKEALEEATYFKEQLQLFSDNLYNTKLFAENIPIFSTVHLNYMPYILG